MFIGGRLCQKAKAALREQLKSLKVKHEKASGGPAALPAASSIAGSSRRVTPLPKKVSVSSGLNPVPWMIYL
jgi:hypothetical protein